jgi:predicted amidohydrolase
LEDLTVAAIQMNGELGKVEQNLDKIRSYTSKAAREGADLVVFPELAITGHWCSTESWKVAQPVPGGRAVGEIEGLASEHGLHISVGIGERERNVQYNTQVLVGPDGYIGKQRKLHMSGDEYFYFRAGTEIPVLEAGKCRVGTVICYDNIFPEVSRILALRGAEVVLSPHAARFGKWRQRGQKKIVADQKKFYRKVYSSRAYDNGVFHVVVNQAGPAGEETNHAGGTMVLDPSGEVVAESKTKVIEEEMIVAKLESSALDARRSGRCFNLVTRRPEIYGEISKTTY